MPSAFICLGKYGVFESPLPWNEKFECSVHIFRGPWTNWLIMQHSSIYKGSLDSSTAFLANAIYWVPEEISRGHCIGSAEVHIVPASKYDHKWSWLLVNTYSAIWHGTTTKTSQRSIHITAAGNPTYYGLLKKTKALLDNCLPASQGNISLALLPSTGLERLGLVRCIDLYSV